MQTTLKRILFVGRFGGEGGAERHVILSAQELSKAGYETNLALVMRPSNPEVFANFPGQITQPKNGSALSQVMAYVRLWKAVEEHDVVVASSEKTPTYVCWLFCALRKKPLVAEVQISLNATLAKSPFHRLLCRMIYPQIKFIRCVSHGVAHDLVSNMNVPQASTEVLYGPFDLEEIRRRANDALPPNDQKLFTSPPIVAAGRLDRQKRFDLAIEAVAMLPEDLNARLVILGDGEERERLQEQIEKLGMTQKIYLLGFRENPFPYFAKASLFLLSSDFEGLGRVIVEALAVGCPVVSTDCQSGPREILGKDFGLLVPVGDVTAMRNACERVLGEKELADNLRMRGPSRASDFNAAKTNEQFTALLERAYSTIGSST